jgi:LysM repeat protein
MSDPAGYPEFVPDPPPVPVVSSTPQPSSLNPALTPTYGATGAAVPAPASAPAAAAPAPVPTPAPVTVSPTQPINPAPVASSASYTVVHGDTFSGIAAANGLSTSQLETLNPQIRDPDLIFPGQSVNLGSAVSTSPTTMTPPVEGVTAQSTSGTNDSNTDVSNSAGATETIGFPSTSSYPLAGAGQEAEKAVEDVSKTSGWGDANSPASTDVAKSVLEIDAHTDTDPLPIDDKKLP